MFIEGRLQQDRWESQEGKKMSRVRVTAENIQFLGARPGGGGAAAAPEGGPAAEEPPAPAEEDIPF